MSWYKKYLPVFEKPFKEVPQATIDEIKEKMKGFQSQDPLATIVVIAHNEEKRLLSCLWSLCENDLSYPVEIIGVDNSSTDRTQDVFDAVGVKWFLEERKSPGYARDCGQTHARGKYYVCIDSDTMYPHLYLQTLLDELEKPGVVGVYSLWSFLPDKQFPEWKLKIYEGLRDISLVLQSFKRPELCVRGMVFAYDLELGRKIGYNHNIIRGEDGSMAFGLKNYGKLVFLKNRKARAITCNNMLHSEGSIAKAMFKRFFKIFRFIGGYFVKKDFYKDQDSNLIKK
jgi:glycosyltransferase involved in cell wall biosynthesis